MICVNFQESGALRQILITEWTLANWLIPTLTIFPISHDLYKPKDSSLLGEKCLSINLPMLHKHHNKISGHKIQNHTYPDANRSFVGFHAQINTSDSCPLSTVDLLLGISRFPSISIASEWFAEERKRKISV